MTNHYFSSYRKDLEYDLKPVQAACMFDKGLNQELIWENLQTAKHIYRLLVEHFRDCQDIAAKAMYQLGLVYEKLKEYANAVACFSNVLEYFPNQLRICYLAKLKCDHYAVKSKQCDLI